MIFVKISGINIYRFIIFFFSYPPNQSLAWTGCSTERWRLGEADWSQSARGKTSISIWKKTEIYLPGTSANEVAKFSLAEWQLIGQHIRFESHWWFVVVRWDLGRQSVIKLKHSVLHYKQLIGQGVWKRADVSQGQNELPQIWHLVSSQSGHCIRTVV